MNHGPCLCGDPYCPSCGNPAAAELEAAEQAAIERLAAAKLSPEEYAAVIDIGLAALAKVREHAGAQDVALRAAGYLKENKP